MFLSVDDYPAISKLAAQVQSQYELLREFAERVSSSFTEWPEPLHAGGWDVYALKWQGEVLLPVIELFPWLARSAVLNAGFSRLAPGTVIEPHTGYEDDVLRLHLGICCPAGDCAIRVGGEERQWKEGDVLLFDDHIEHSAWNKTESPRVILLLDVLRDRHR